MKRTRKLTRTEKEILSKHYMKVDEWRFEKQITDSYFKVANERTGKTKIVCIF